MNLPKQFTIAGIKHTVERWDVIDEGQSYGKYYGGAKKIVVAYKALDDGDMIELSDDLVLNTFYHELVHAFQYYYTCEFDETQAQVYANFLCEFENSKIE